ncbi:hypothetical protein QJS10_CPA05g00630 [Acorus calamus]|uniref:CRAL-TRIO domain-containing protein n=1 Tax=Acorus calamus TaxID=4465 RepID=A0AAV9EX88_ACOCL|nr:hypothetical protein QJS10_CPA05g00630 [Acorus calamus]
MFSKKPHASGSEKTLRLEEQKVKIKEVRRLIGPLSDKVPNYCSDACISRYLRARNWNVRKATKMLIATLKWRIEYKPEAIHWEEIAHEAETGKIYRAKYLDKHGRTVLVMRPGFQNTNSMRGQIRYLVYCLEKAILNMAPDQEQMVWFIDFQGWNSACVSLKVARETAHVLQDHYPERLGLAILYNPPKIFEAFFAVVKPFLEPKTYKKVKFVYSDDKESQKIMEEHFNMDKLESSLGGHNPDGFNYVEYGERMRQDDAKTVSALSCSADSLSANSVVQGSDTLISESGLELSDESSSDGDTDKLSATVEAIEVPNLKA